MNKSQWFDAATKAGRMLEDGRGGDVAIRYANLMVKRSPFPPMETRDMLIEIFPTDCSMFLNVFNGTLIISRAQ